MRCSYQQRTDKIDLKNVANEFVQRNDSYATALLAPPVTNVAQALKILIFFN